MISIHFSSLHILYYNFLYQLCYCVLENIDDIVCPNKDLHGPSYTRCTEGFAIFNEFKDAIKEKENKMAEVNTTTQKKQ